MHSHLLVIYCLLGHVAPVLDLRLDSPVYVSTAYLELAGSSVHALPVLAVHNIDEAVCVVEVVPPQRAQLLLASYIPDCEQHILVLHLLHIEACRCK